MRFFHASSVPVALMATLVCIGAPASSSAFVFETMNRAFAANPSLVQFTEAQLGQSLNINLNVEAENSKNSRLAVTGLVLNLSPTAVHDKKATLTMPGADGPRANLSAGKMKATVIKPGSFIDLTGRREVAPTDASWEMVWRYEAPAGSIVCGLQLPEEYRRNDAKLPQGNVYLTFPVWTRDKLVEMQKSKVEILELAHQHLVERDEHLEKMHSTDNLFAKAMHYRNAAEAVEKYTLYNVSGMKAVPEMEDVMSIGGDLLLTRQGTLWTKGSTGGGSFLGGGSKNVLLGTAIISNPLAEGLAP